MKNLKRVNVLGEIYTITQEDGFKDAGLLGLCDNEKQKIHIYPVQEKELYTKTMLHEIIHAISHQSGLSQSLPREVEEMICEIIPNVLCKNFDLRAKKETKRKRKKSK